MPKISVIVPVYNVAGYIERCAMSLFEQTLHDIEYIFIDDCTPDDSMEILQSVIEKYKLRFMAEKKIVKIGSMPAHNPPRGGGPAGGNDWRRETLSFIVIAMIGWTLIFMRRCTTKQSNRELML